MDHPEDSVEVEDEVGGIARFLAGCVGAEEKAGLNVDLDAALALVVIGASFDIDDLDELNCRG
jgi:hypothetical protein